jgi:hypothetical protein
MGKLSKSDGPQEAAFWDMPTSEHFTVGTFVKIAHETPAEIVSVDTCKCRKAEKSLLLRLEDGSLRRVVPIALNHHLDKD